MADQAKQVAVYNFLRQHARSGTTFRVEDVNAAMGWSGQTGSTYISKHFKAYLEKVAPGVHRVIPEFKRLSWEEFQGIVTQVRRPLAKYNRTTFHSVVVFDFLMPLTREDKLRKTLDELFYRDTLERRIQEVGLDVLERTIPREMGFNDAEYVGQIIAFIEARIGGFSISHVSGRFRTSGIITRKESALRASRDQPYLIDETTAVVRFIIPCLTSKEANGSDFGLGDPTDDSTKAVEREVDQIRTIFVELFVEALVPTIRGEALIWMLETSPRGQRLYELARIDEAKSDAKDLSSQDETGDDEAADESQ